MKGDLPEGLHAYDTVGGTRVIADAQDHIWVELYPKAPGDPEEWQIEIEERVMDTLNACLVED